MIESVRILRGVNEIDWTKVLGMDIGIEDHWVGGAKECVNPERNALKRPYNQQIKPCLLVYTGHPIMGNWSIAP